MTAEVVALDLFAGTGWGVALQARGIREGGVEIMPEARASRAAAGMETPFADVWDMLLNTPIDSPWFKAALRIASPPCQSFSVAGKGAGRAALDDVLRAIDDGAYRDPHKLRVLGAETDDRTALVLTPLADVDRHRPTYVTWEQVTPVLPVWEACAEVMRGMGYSVWVGIIRAEQYGVPQTRRRAVLIARADGIEAAPPTPTHSRYYERDPQRLDDGVLPWVSMADAIGEHGTRALRSNYGTGGDASRRGERLVTQPAPTITSKAGRNKWDGRRPMWIVEAAALQTYPRGFVFGGNAGAQFLQIGNAVPPLMGGAIIDELLAPAALRAVPEVVERAA